VALVVMGLTFTHSFTRDRFMIRRNQVQLSYIAAAESLTGPNDTVLDAVGMVLTRKPPHPDWMLLGRSMPYYHQGWRKTFARIMIDTPSPVLIDNLRWGWLPEEDLRVRDERYVAIRPGLFVLGQRLTRGAGQFVVHASGRYRVEGARVDGRAGMVDLTAGPHAYSDAEMGAVYWLGPNGLTEPPLVQPLVFTGDEMFAEMNAF
jgi:hypothetical protein